MSTTMTVSEARAALPRILESVAAGDEVTITRHGQPVAVIVRPDALRVRRAGDRLLEAERIRDLLAAGRRTRLPRRGALGERQADALIDDVRLARRRR
jgi:prevent-host-death family protein